MGDHQDFLELVSNRVDSLNQALSAALVLAPEAFIDDQHLKLGTGTTSKKTRKREPYGEVNPESFTAREGFIFPSIAVRVNNNIQGYHLNKSGEI